MGLSEQDIYDLRMWFEEALNHSAKKEEKQKIISLNGKIHVFSIPVNWQNFVILN